MHLSRACRLGLGALVAATFLACGGRADESTTSPVASVSGGAAPSVVAQTEPTSCESGSVTFQLQGPPGWWVTQSIEGSAPGQSWLSVSCPCGAEVILAPTITSTSRDCSTCPAAWETSGTDTASPLGPEGVTQVWDGIRYLPGTCGASLQCVRRVCAEPGHYFAHMCGCAPANVNEGNCSKPVCVTIPFDYPAADMITGFLPKM